MKKRVSFVAAALFLAVTLLSACAAPARIVPSVSTLPQVTDKGASNTIESPSPTVSVSILPPVTDTGAVYTHAESGFTITYPADWTVLSDAEIAALYEQVGEQLKTLYKDPAQYEAAKEQSIPVSYAFLHSLDEEVEFNANMNILIMAIPAVESEDIVALAEQAAEAAESAAAEGAFKIGEVSAAKVGGVDAAVVEATLTTQGIEIPEKQYYVAHNDYLVIITLGAFDTDMATLQKAVDNVRFE